MRSKQLEAESFSYGLGGGEQAHGTSVAHGPSRAAQRACAKSNTESIERTNMRRKKYITPARPLTFSPIVSACVGGALLAGLPTSNAQAQGADAARIEKL